MIKDTKTKNKTQTNILAGTPNNKDGCLGTVMALVMFLLLPAIIIEFYKDSFFDWLTGQFYFYNYFGSFLIIIAIPTFFFAFIYYIGYKIGWSDKKNDFIFPIKFNKISTINDFTIIPFPIGKNSLSTMELNLDGGPAIIIPSPHKEVIQSNLTLLSLIIFVGMLLKNYFDIIHLFHLWHPIISLLIDIFLIDLTLFIGWKVGTQIFTGKFTANLGKRITIVNDYLCIDMTMFTLVCPLWKFDKYTIKDSEEIYKTWAEVEIKFPSYPTLKFKSTITRDELTNELDKDFPWKDILVFKNQKKSFSTGRTEQEIRKILEGVIKCCPKCGKGLSELEIFYFRSPEWTWHSLCGRAGWLVICISCKKQIYFICEEMN